MAPYIQNGGFKAFTYTSFEYFIQNKAVIFTNYYGFTKLSLHCYSKTCLVKNQEGKSCNRDEFAETRELISSFVK